MVQRQALCSTEWKPLISWIAAFGSAMCTTEASSGALSSVGWSRTGSRGLQPDSTRPHATIAASAEILNLRTFPLLPDSYRMSGLRPCR
jgi:hypothetical protein